MSPTLLKCVRRVRGDEVGVTQLLLIKGRRVKSPAHIWRKIDPAQLAHYKVSTHPPTLPPCRSFPGDDLNSNLFLQFTNSDRDSGRESQEGKPLTQRWEIFTETFSLTLGVIMVTNSIYRNSYQLVAQFGALCFWYLPWSPTRWLYVAYWWWIDDFGGEGGC